MARMKVDKGCVHGAGKESIDELEGKEVDTRFIHGRKRKDRRRANADRQSLGSNRNNNSFEKDDAGEVIISFAELAPTNNILLLLTTSFLVSVITHPPIIRCWPTGQPVGQQVGVLGQWAGLGE